STVNPANDFFDYANGGWIKRNPIPPEESGWSIGNLVVNENLKRLKEINEQAAKTTAASGSSQQKIGDFWTTAMDTDKIEKDGIRPLQQYLDKIAAISDEKTLGNSMAELDKIGVGGPIDFYINQDAKNSEVNALQLWQAGLGLPEREFYFKTDSTSVVIRDAYVNHMAKMLVLLGEDAAHAETAAKNIMALETELAKSHRKIEDLRDPYANYNKYAVKDLYKLAPAIDWNNYMTIYGVAKIDSVIIGQPEYYKEASKMLQGGALDTWKDYLRYRLADAFAIALPDAFGKEDFEFSKLFSGAKERKPRWKRVLRSEESVMGELLGQLYVKEFFDSTAKKRYEDLVEAIRSSLKNRIEALTWMNDSTKQKALAKLAAVKKKVGYPDKWKDFSAMQIGKESYVQNLVNAALWWHNYQINKLGKPVDKDEWTMYPQTYNAYYNPSNNEIVLPAGIFTVPGFRDEELDDALVYGYAGASTIGHELTHGFDDEGRQYDAKGNLTNWWTKDDEKKFKSRADVMVKQFANYVVIDTFKINGKATLGENIADLGGILLGWDAFKNTEEYKKNEKIGGLTPSQRYFLGYALGWLGHNRNEQLRTQVLTDVHSPAKYRVNGPFSDVDAFYDVFNVKPGNKMYLPDSMRVRIW
ncbi:MAG TPA: M13 family metallopeptidase, partial [Chitinophagaceae bacterium]